jgi:hypothetical protein
MEGLNVKQVAREQGLTISAIYSRVHCKWTLKEILDGFRWQKPKEMANRYDYASGQTAFIVMLFDIIKSITKLDDIDNYPLTVGVYYDLLNFQECEV